MKILQLGKFYPIRGGVEKVMWDLTKGISSRGIDCDMLCATLDEEKTIDFGEHGHVFCVKALAKKAATMLSPAMVARLRRIAGDYDIIHVHHPDPMACLALMLSGYKGKVVLHWHSDILSQKVLLAFYEPLQRWLIRRADLIVGTTPVYVQNAPALKDVQHKVTYLPIGVEDVSKTPSCTPDLLEKLQGKKIVFSLGRLVPYKGYTYLVDAASYLNDSYHVVIGGDGPLREILEKQIVDSGLGDKVTLLGRVSDEELPAWYQSCSLFCLSSIWKTEAFAIVQVEAMSCAKPVVATSIPDSGVSWVNAHGVSGLNVPPEDPHALANAIMDICEEKTRYDDFCVNARARFETVFGFDRMIDGCIGLYQSILSK